LLRRFAPRNDENAAKLSQFDNTVPALHHLAEFRRVGLVRFRSSMAGRSLGILKRTDRGAETSARRTLGTRGLGPAALGLAIASSLATFLVLAGFTPIEPTHYAVVVTLAVNGAFALFLLVLIVRELRRIRRARREGQPGAELHSRVALLFGLVAAAPALALATMATITIDRGLDEWFSTRAHTVLTNAVVVARAYLNDQARSIHAEILAMANDVNRERPLFDTDRAAFRDFMTMQATVRGMSTAWLMHHDGKVVDRINVGPATMVPPPPPGAFDPSRADEPAILSPGAQNLIGAVFKLSNYDDLWLFVTRPVDPKATQYLRNTEEAASEYSVLAQRRFGVQVAFGLMYFVIALTLLLAAIWLGLAFANSLVAPLRRLIAAADQVTVGNLYVQVPVGRRESDLGGLSETFNRMTAQLRTQRNALLDASEQIDRRRRFTEAVLSGVSAGVVGLDAEGTVTLLNRTAEALLAASEADLLGRPLAEAVPEFADLFADARDAARPVQQTVVVRRGRRERTLSVRFAAEQSGGPEPGSIVTFDDISDLVSAQRTAAWADVARRIAHEIKNPLTPIQLSAERIRRKYGKMITTDREVFDQCTNTIVRQVDDIKRMVDEFSSFARMPKPVMEPEDLGTTVGEVAVMMRDGYPDIAIDYTPPAAPILARFDRRLISRALTNVVKNAAESVRAAKGDGGGGHIAVTLSGDARRAVVDVVDNGLGLPAEHRSRLLEPYVTTREKGTGLGLAIVAKIAEEHGGGIELLDSPAVADGGHGALVRLWFSLDGAVAPAAEAAISSEQ
jgi:two-component system nitrogen regulation sensor histidine kinase NtrY